MADVRALAIFHGPSGLAADDIVNTFHFSTVDDYADLASRAAEKIVQFYTNVSAGGVQVNPIVYYFSPWVQTTWEIRTYDLAQAKPRVPIITEYTMTGRPAGGGLPEECAVALSYHGNPPNGARRRGRIYLGPLATWGGTQATATAPARPHNDLVRDVCVSAHELAEDPVFDVGWSIRSSLPAQNFVRITGGYVDNAFDTQRRRGPDPDGRTTFTTSAAP